MTAVMFFAGAWGYLQLLKLPVPPGQANALPAGGGSLLSNSTALLALAALVATAVLAGVLAAVPWFSPLASGLPGLLLLAWTGLYLVSVRRAVEFIPLRSHSFGAGWEGLLFNGILGAVGAVMVFPMFIPSRWRGPRLVESDEFTSDVDDYLSAVTTDDGATAAAERGARRRSSAPWWAASRPSPAVSGRWIPAASPAPRGRCATPAPSASLPARSRVLPAPSARSRTQACSGRPYYRAADE